MKIQYIVHSTTLDNENHVVSGWHDCPLSSLGAQQAHDLHIQLQHLETGRIYNSPLMRAKQTAAILFPNVHTQEDDRLKEINYGSLTLESKDLIDTQRKDHINEQFPNGESYMNVEERMRLFVADCLHIPLITVVAHQAPQLALDIICNGSSWEKAFADDWRLKKNGWKPFWIYEFKYNR